MRNLVYPLTYDYHGKPSVRAFSIQRTHCLVATTVDPSMKTA